MDNPTPWNLMLVLLLLAWAIGCATRPPSSDPPGWETTSLLVEHAVLATASARIAECPECREDFQTTYDVLYFLLEEGVGIPLDQFVGTLSSMRLTEFRGPDGTVELRDGNVWIQGKAIETQMINFVAEAVWVALGKALDH